MRKNNSFFSLLMFFMIIFILGHALLSEMGFFANSGSPIMSILGGFSLSTNHDSVSTRNPAIESFIDILSDLPGAYSFYFSPIMVAPPTIKDQLLPRWIGVWNSRETDSSIVSKNVLVFTLLTFSGLVSLSLLHFKRRYSNGNKKTI